VTGRRAGAARHDVADVCGAVSHGDNGLAPFADGRHRRLAHQSGLKKALLTMLQPAAVFWSVR